MCIYVHIYIYCLDQTTDFMRRDSPLCNFTESCRSDLVKTLCPKKCGKAKIYLEIFVLKQKVFCNLQVSYIFNEISIVRLCVLR